MNDVKRYIYETTLEIAFAFENALNIKIKSINFHFNKNSICDLLVRPYMIVFVDTEDVKHKYLLNEIIDLLSFIPIYKLSKEPSVEYNSIDMNNKVTSYPASSSIIQSLKESEMKSCEYIHDSPIDEEVIDMIIDILLEYNIMFYETKEGIYLYDKDPSKVKYNILIPYVNRNITHTGYCILPSPHEFTNTVSLGRFTYFMDKSAMQPIDYNLALITKCHKCNKNIICNWQSFKGTPCPYCDSIVNV